MGFDRRIPAPSRTTIPAGPGPRRAFAELSATETGFSAPRSSRSACPQPAPRYVAAAPQPDRGPRPVPRAGRHRPRDLLHRRRGQGHRRQGPRGHRRLQRPASPTETATETATGGTARCPTRSRPASSSPPTGLRSAIKVMEKEVPGKSTRSRSAATASTRRSSRQQAGVRELQRRRGGAGDPSISHGTRWRWRAQLRAGQRPGALPVAEGRQPARQPLGRRRRLRRRPGVPDEVVECLLRGGTPYAQGDSRGRLLRVG